VVLGCLDPNPKVNGNGIAQLRAAGVEVVTGVLEAEAKQLLAPFIARTVLGRPYVTLKWAQSANGLIAGKGGARRQISGPESVEVVHALRGRCDAILVGGQTARTDDPLLTARPAQGDPMRPLLRCVITRSGDLSPTLKLMSTPDLGETAIYQGTLAEMMADLHARGVTHLLVESGAQLSAALVSQNLVDRAWVFRSPETLNEEGVRALYLDWAQTGEVRTGKDTLHELLNPKSAAYFAKERSADLMLVK
jgi:diaminohydroxyphosphoribosylaminopyrimidine deaminase/5-amino-6-(5-phosphoribosylamino)uracil reductase